MKWTFFVAHRLLWQRPASRRGATGVLSILGIAAGVTTLIAVLGVMNGFQLGQINSILELNSFHVRLEPGADDRNTIPEGFVEQVAGLPGVRYVMPMLELQTIGRGYWPNPEGIVVRAVPTDWFSDDSGAAEILRTVTGSLSVREAGTTVVGAELARSLGVRVGDTISVVYLPAGRGRPQEAQLEVAGTFRSGYLDFDRSWALTSIATARDVLAAREAPTVVIKLHDRFQDARVAETIRSVLREQGRPAVSIVSWRDYNRGIFGALRTEKLFMAGFIALVFVVVAFNIAQSLRRAVFERREEIAMFAAFGATRGAIAWVFILEGVMIGVIGVAVGTVAGLAIAYNVNEIFAFLVFVAESIAGAGAGQFAWFSPMYFYIESVPVRVLPGELVLIAAGALGAATVAAYLAAHRTTVLRPAEILREE